MKRIFTSYRPDQYGDPDAFMFQVAAVLAGYSEAVVVRMTDPRNPRSIQRTHKWPPTLAELSTALDADTKLHAAETKIARINALGFSWNDERNGFYNPQGERFDARKHANDNINALQAPTLNQLVTAHTSRG